MIFKAPGIYLWDVRVTNAGDGWQLEPIPKASRGAIEALGLMASESLAATSASDASMA